MHFLIAHWLLKNRYKSISYLRFYFSFFWRDRWQILLLVTFCIFCNQRLITLSSDNILYYIITQIDQNSISQNRKKTAFLESQESVLVFPIIILAVIRYIHNLDQIFLQPEFFHLVIMNISTAVYMMSRISKIHLYNTHPSFYSTLICQGSLLYIYPKGLVSD